MGVFNSEEITHATLQDTSPQGVPSEGFPSPQGVIEGLPITAGDQMPRRLGFFEAEQIARKQIDLSTLYVKPSEPTDAQSLMR